MLVLGQDGCIWAYAVVFGQQWLYSGKSGNIRARWLISGKLVVFGKKWLYSGIVAFFGQKWLFFC